MLSEHYFAIGLPRDAQIETMAGRLVGITPTQRREITAVVAAGEAGMIDEADPVRAIRAILFAETDYTQAADSPLPPGDRAAWAAYRQALRDLPATVVEGQPVQWPAFPALGGSSVPSSVSARQIRLWLVTHGIPLAAVEAAIDTITDPAAREAVRVEWEYAPYILRSHPMLVPLAAAFGMTDEQVDAAFVEASLI
jgi:hypothetical protein